MNVNGLKVAATRSLNKAGFALKKKAPTLLVIGGSIGVVASTVLACKSTLKVNEVLDETNEDLANIHAVRDGEVEIEGEYTESDYKKDLVTVYVRTGVKLAKLYLPSIIVGVISIGAISKSHQILCKRNAALAASYSVLDGAYREYRKRVQEELGAEMDRHFQYGTRLEEITVQETDAKGKVKETKKKVEVIDDASNARSMYSRFFDSSSLEYVDDADYNKMYIMQIQNQANDMLRTKGHVSLNEVYKLWGYTQKFNELIKESKNIKWEEVDKKVAENFIKSMSFIFDETKKTNPISYAVFYSMQYTFWQVVVVGGILTNKKLSARLLTNSLSILGKEPNDMLIEDDETIKTILDSKAFKDRIKKLIKTYGEGKDEFVVNENNPKEDILMHFEKSDLLYALHDATMFEKAKKDIESKWKFEIEIIDTYDFTDFKELKEYADREDVITDILSTTLNNLGVVSYEYGVIKPYNVKIEFETKEGEF
mgnify:CR=1 FL=1